RRSPVPASLRWPPLPAARGPAATDAPLPHDPSAIIGVECPDHSGLLADRQQAPAVLQRDEIGGCTEVEVGPARLRTIPDDITQPRERPGDSMTGTAQGETPHVGIFWLVQTSNGEARLLTAGCPLDQVEPYGDC